MAANHLRATNHSDLIAYLSSSVELLSSNDVELGEQLKCPIDFDLR